MAGAKNKRPIREPGGVLLIGFGMSGKDLSKAIEQLYPHAVSLTVLTDSETQKAAAAADELWIYAPLGLRGFIALMRRISWRRFDAVYQPSGKPFWFKYLVWPRPDWYPAYPSDYAPD